MSRMLDNRQSRGTWGFRAFGLFVAVWLNLALAPCAMAYKAAQDHDCPNCPPVVSNGHHDMHDGHDATMEMPCADGLSDCMIDDDVTHDGRQGQLKTDYDCPTAVAVVADEPQAHARADASIAVPRYSSIHPGAPPPIHLLNCVFLD